MNLYVANLSQDVNDEDLRKTFEVYGQVTSAKVITDRYSGDSRGFGFVEMPVKTEGLEAISGLNSQEIKGRNLVVSEARPKRDNRGSSRGGGGQGGYGGGGGQRRY
jgi:RNA recognition motif-containing protein